MPAVHGSESTTRGVIIKIESGVATLLVGEQQEEWDFPLQVLPDGAVEDSVVLLAGEGYGLHAVGLSGKHVDTVETRLARGVNRRRLATIA